MQIPISRPSIKRSDMDAVLSCMVTDSLGPGVLSSRLVRLVADYLGVTGGIAIREYPRAIKIAFEAMGLSRGDRVLLTPLHPSVYTKVAREMDIEPVYVDVNPENGCISETELAKLDLTSIRAIISFAPLGFVPPVEKLLETGIPLIEDVSQAIGANTANRRLGTFGSYTLISLEPDGIITSGGGVLVLGKGRKEVNILQKIVEPYQYDILLPDFNAALGITQIQSIERFLSKRKDIAQLFSQALLRTRHKLLFQPDEAENVYYSFPILISSGLKDVQAYCRKQGIETILAFQHSILGMGFEQGKHFPAAQALYLRCLLYPLYPSLTKSSIEHMQKVLTSLP
ncbi:MAG: DegT/DnrJ/EryC1/StrS family aminotransferase [Spirochaetes bacterium]|nr:DegT/DnrJ/EryC1/StrS family aminotransferase [Spirochaetota bacterium]